MQINVSCIPVYIAMLFVSFYYGCTNAVYCEKFAFAIENSKVYCLCMVKELGRCYRVVLKC